MLKFISRVLPIFISCFFIATTAGAQVQVTHFQQHSVANGETAASICTMYKLDLTDFLLLNDFPKDVKLKPGTVVLVRELKEDDVKPEEIQAPSPVSGFRESRPVINLSPEPYTVTTNEKPVASTRDYEYGPHGTIYRVSKTGYHQVERKHTCFRIALIYGLTLEELMQLNGLSDYNIRIGQRLKVKK